MPITTGAIRKLRADKKKLQVNLRTKSGFKQAIVAYRKKPTATLLKKVYSLLDRAAKKGVVHRNKASRLKSRLAVLVAAKS